MYTKLTSNTTWSTRKAAAATHANWKKPANAEDGIAETTTSTPPQVWLRAQRSMIWDCPRPAAALQ